MPAVLRITGAHFALESIARESALAIEETTQSRKKRRQWTDATQTDSTYRLVVSNSDGDHVLQQIEEACVFLEANEEALRSIFNALLNCRRTLDFSWDFPDGSLGQFNRFPTTLLSQLNAFGIELGVSVYGVTNSTD
ncbi:hypothetical protein [Rhodopirellula baltica]|uniref:hypothetical protein n=1 Tax=Rhodopirellula baltica TaxID=265606 RepID=UPI001F3CBFA2|nr:hypothetical protein [Rhodopirellula baltica]